jgi:hypothetical protein
MGKNKSLLEREETQKREKVTVDLCQTEENTSPRPHCTKKGERVRGKW